MWGGLGWSGIIYEPINMKLLMSKDGRFNMKYIDNFEHMQMVGLVLNHLHITTLAFQGDYYICKDGKNRSIIIRETI